jgi:peptidoglycan/xylan/chitin deacetylase (PgdA/CDA1 family)
LKHNIILTLFAVAVIISSYFLIASPYFIGAIAILVLVLILVIVFGASFIQFNYFVSSINQSENKGIAFTFDDGPHPKITPQLLSILAQENIKATFFVIGHQLDENKALLLKIHNEGHTIGNHSYRHTKKLTLFSTTHLIDDIEKCSVAIEKIIHQKPMLFRPPFGITTPRYQRALKHLDMNSIGWNIRSLDTVSKDKEALYKKITSSISNGSIILFHDTQQITVDVLPEIIQFCKTNNITIVPLPELINIPAYE